MAQQATRKRAESDTKPVNKGGRPVGSRNAVKVKTFDFDAPKRDFQKYTDFLAYAEGYPDKTALLFSLYRLRPKIDNSLMGIDQSAILQTAEFADVTEEAIGEKFGRGKYMLKLNDSNKGKGLQLRCRTWLELFDVEKPPQYDPRTLCLGEAQNQDEIMRLLNMGVLVRDAHGAPRLRGENDPLPIASPPAAAAGAGHGADLFGRDVVGQIVLAALNRGNQSPHDAVKDTIEVARMLAPAQPAVDVEILITRVVERLQKGSGSDDAFTQYERMEAFLGRVRGPMKAASAVADAVADLPAVGDGPSSWAPFLGGILAQARSLIPEVIGAFRELRAENGGATNGAPPPQPNGVQRPMNMEQRIEQIARMGFERMTEGVSGFDFAAWVCNFHVGGFEVYKTLEPAGAVGVIALAAMNPATRALVNDPATRTKLEEFLNDFFTFDTDGGTHDAEPSGATASAAAA